MAARRGAGLSTALHRGGGAERPRGHGGARRARGPRGGHPPAREITWQALLALSGLALILLGLWVHRRRPQPATALFLLLSVLLALIFKPSLQLPPEVPAPLEEWVLQAAQLGFPPLLIHFVMLFPPRAGGPQPSRRRLAAVYLPAVALLLVNGSVATAALAAPGEYHRALEAAQGVAALYFLGALAVASALLLRTYRRVRTTVERNRMRVALWGTLVGLLPPALTTVALMWVPLSAVPWSRYASLSLLLVPAAFADAAVRHRLFDFEVAFKRGLVYSTLAAASLAVYVLLAQVAGRWLSRATHLPDLVWPALSVFAAGLLFAPARARLSTAVDQLFLRGPFDYRAALLRLTHELARVPTVDALMERGFPGLLAALGLKQLAFYHGSAPEALRLRRAVPADADPPAELCVPPDCALAGLDEAAPWDPDTAAWSGLPLESRRALDAMRACALAPLRLDGRLVGLWVLGPRAAGPWYEPADLELLTGLSDQTSRALDRERAQREAETQAHLKRELLVARHLQRMLVPAHTPIYPTLDLASASLPCEEVGGDYFDFMPQGDHRFGFVIADSSGKGVPAALLMAGLQAQFRAEAPRHPSPGELLALLNARVRPEDDPRRYVALFYAQVDVRERRIRYANGGHPPPMLLRASGSVERLNEGGLLLGVSPDAGYPEGELQLERGDLLVFYTDGVVEERSGDDFYGDGRLESALARHRHLRAHRLVDRVIEDVQAFSGAPLGDDVTVVAMKFL
ncbi:MAG: SpoIIE family protein phosphatase [Candidatus Eisenbacteria bacterium]|nr:SpoIIE family protein phosphatase [Candidatus Eisenbacteria bacterium]